MKSAALCLFTLLIFCDPFTALSQYGRIYDVAGGAPIGYGIDSLGDGCHADSAFITNSQGIWVGEDHSFYFVDVNKYIIRKVDGNSKIISIIAGNKTAGYSGDGGLATSAQISSNAGNVFGDTAGNIYFSDGSNYRIRMISAATGHIQTICGNGSPGYSGDGGLAFTARTTPGNIYINTAGDLFFIDFNENSVRKIIKSTGVVDRYAGSAGLHYYSGDGGAATSAGFVYPYAVTGDKYGNIYVTDDGNHTIRKINSSGIISTIAGSNTISAYSGDGSPASASLLSYPQYICCDTFGNIYFTDQNNRVIRKIDVATGLIHTVAGTTLNPPGSGKLWTTGIPADSANLRVYGIFCDNNGDIYYATYNNDVRKITAASSAISTLYVTDSFVSTGCVVPRTVAIGIHGIVNGTPSSTDSMRISIDYKDPFTSNAKRDYTLPYKYVGGYYTFGDTFNRFDTYTYKVPGSYMPVVSFHTVGGFADVSSPPNMQIGSKCSSGISQLFIDSVADTITTKACVNPGLVRFTAKGRVTGAVLPDSIYLVYQYNNSDTGYDLHLAPIFISGSSYTFRDTATHRFFETGNYNATIWYITPAGVKLGQVGFPGLSFFSCSTGSVTASIADTARILPTCNVPYFDKFSPSGVVSGLAATYDSVSIHVDFKDGLDTVYKMPITTDGHGTYHYNINTAYVTHQFSTNGIFTTTDTVAAGTYKGIGTAKTLNIGTSPTIDMQAGGWAERLVPGDTGIVTIWCGNMAGHVCDTLQSTIHLTLDPRLTYAGMLSGALPSGVSGSDITWVYRSSSSPQKFFADVKVACSATLTTFDSICNAVHVTANSFTDNDTSNNNYQWCQYIQSPVPVNAKQVMPTGIGPLGLIAKGTQLKYLIHFQNTDTGTKKKVVIIDTISSGLDKSSLQVISSSAPMSYITGPFRVTFTFNNINLRSAKDSPDKSTGYVLFSINSFNYLTAGMQIINKANVYFDSAASQTTNSTLNTIKGSTGPGMVSQVTENGGIEIFPNPANTYLTVRWNTPDLNNAIYSVCDVTGKELLQGRLINNSTIISVGDLPGGVYLIRIKTAVLKFVKE